MPGSPASLDCPLIVDEAYADFADAGRHSIPLIKEHANVIVTRSFSKGYGLAGIRLGYLVARPEMVEQLTKIKDSYNCDTLSQVAGVAALSDQDYLRETRSRIIATRGRLTGRAASDGLHSSRKPIQFRLGDPRPAGPRDVSRNSRIARSWFVS